MIIKVFSIYDGKAECYREPFYMPTVGMAVRAFSDLANDNSSLISKHPEDYVLFEVAEYDDSKGLFKGLNPHNNLGVALGYIKKVVSPEVIKI